MTAIHLAGVYVTLVAVTAYGLVGAYMAVTQSTPRWVHSAWLVGLAVLGIQAVTGIMTAVVLNPPSKLIHWIYGVVAIGLLLGANGVGIGLPPAKRGGIMAGAGAILLLMVWRLSQSG